MAISTHRLAWKMDQKLLSARIISVLYVIVLLLPRQLGLLAANCNVHTRLMSKSTFWKIYSIVCGCIFSIVYPFAIKVILSKTNALSKSGLFAYIEITNYVAMYLFTVAIYIRIMFSSTKHMNYNNLAFSVLDECKSLCNDRKEFEYILPFVIRVIYLYFGYAILNAINLSEHSDDLSDVPIFYKFLYFMPDLVMASTTIRVHTSIAMQVIGCKCINEAISACLERVKKARNVTSPNERMRIYYRECHTFDKITEVHEKLYTVTRRTEELTSNLMIFSILKAFAHLSSMVTVLTDTNENALIFIELFEFTFRFQLFLLIDHLNSSQIWDMDFIKISVVRCIFCILDLLFMFCPASQLKRELHMVGKILYNGSTNLPSGLQRSVNIQFSIAIFGL